MCQLGAQRSQNFAEVIGEENVECSLVKVDLTMVLKKLFLQDVGEHERKTEATVNLWGEMLKLSEERVNRWFLLSAQTLLSNDA